MKKRSLENYFQKSTYLAGGALLTLCLLLSSCNFAAEDAPESTTQQKEAQNKLKLGSVYPHTESFLKGQHGEYYYQDAKTCQGCHGEDFLGGNSKVSCNSCHSHFPHPGGWGQPSSHGHAFLEIEISFQQKCLNCHQNSSGFGRATSCKSCHSLYPHREDLTKSDGVFPHKDLAKKGTERCLDCHEKVIAANPNLSERIGCASCHGKGFPHNSGWANPSAHGSLFVGLKNEERALCLKCHSPSNQDQKDKPASCQQCHVAYPHPEKFSKASKHAEIAGTYQGKCTLCHTDLKRHMDPNKFDEDGCFSCHEQNTLPRVKWIETPKHEIQGEQERKPDSKPDSKTLTQGATSGATSGTTRHPQ